MNPTIWMPFYKFGRALVKATTAIMYPSLPNAGTILYFPLYLSDEVLKYFANTALWCYPKILGITALTLVPIH